MTNQQRNKLITTISVTSVQNDLLKDLKMNVEKIPGPKKKKKMIRAFKSF